MNRRARHTDYLGYITALVITAFGVPFAGFGILGVQIILAKPSAGMMMLLVPGSYILVGCISIAYSVCLVWKTWRDQIHIPTLPD